MLSTPNKRSSGFVWLLALVAVAAVAASELPAGAEKLADESKELTDDDLSAIVNDFGKQMEEMLRGQVDELVEELAEDPNRIASKQATASIHLDEQQLLRLKAANAVLSKNAASRIGLAANQHLGEVSRASWKYPVRSGASSFAEKVSQRLQSAGNFIGHQMASLRSLAPKVKDKLARIPTKLRALMHWPSFLSFKVKFNKAYRLREELYRQMLYLRTQAVVGVQNLRFLTGHSSYLKRATQFADTTSAEYARDYDNKLAERETDKDLEVATLSADKRELLRRMAHEGRNIFDPQPSEKSEVRRRRKRALSELEESEDSEASEQSQAEDTAAEAAMLDAFNAHQSGADAHGDLASIESLMDNALVGANQSDQFQAIDLRETGCIPAPANQETCGNCYALVVATVASYYDCMAKRTGAPVKYNARFLSDCGRYIYPENHSGDEYIRGCAGGRLGDTIKFAARAGSNELLAYEIARLSVNFGSDSCAYLRPDSIENWAKHPPPAHFKQSEFTFLDMEGVDLHLRTVGPVFVNVYTWKDFATQGQGIFDGLEDDRRPIAHSMLIVGQDRDLAGRHYYILWNSHGTDWGDNGFVRIYAESLRHFKIYSVGLIPN